MQDKLQTKILPRLYGWTLRLPRELSEAKICGVTSSILTCGICYKILICAKNKFF
jgi:hypothetical protein